MDSSPTPSSTSTQPSEHTSYPKRILHSKRSFHRTGSIDSPAYDASEEDNDPTTDDGATSVISVPLSHQKSRATGTHSNPLKIHNKKHQQVIEDEDPGVDSPTYDGDVESYTTTGPQHINQRDSVVSLRDAHSSSESTVSTMTSPLSRSAGLHPESSHRPPTSSPLTRNETTPIPPRHPSEGEFDPVNITPEEIQKWVRDVIAGHSEDAPASRRYTINPPPTDRPAVIYADGTSGHLDKEIFIALKRDFSGVYDLFHYGQVTSLTSTTHDSFRFFHSHALQLRQAKLSFPSTRLLVGVCSDELVREHKANTIMSHQERYVTTYLAVNYPESPWGVTDVRVFVIASGQTKLFPKPPGSLHRSSSRSTRLTM
jgi:choline-phosphate cytidylyltransferase